MVAEVLSLMIKKVAYMDLISSFRTSPQETVINQLQFADDHIIFIDDNTEQISNLKNILFAFELISDFRVNFKKNAVVHVGETQNARACTDLFGCSCVSFPVNYLGIPLGSKSKASCLPKSVEKEMERIIIWGGSKTVKKKGWVGWDKVNASKHNGGVGIKKLSIMNKKLHAKWIWRYDNEKDVLWRKVVKQKFDGNSMDIFPNSPNRPVNKSLSVGIVKCKDIVISNYVIHVNSGNISLFWKDLWCNGLSLKILFPNIFMISISKDFTISEVVSNCNGSRTWNLNLIRYLNDTELNELVQLLNFIPEPNSLTDGEDVRVWRTGETFTVSGFLLL
ncbi:uncharacterized protein LOC113272482 [Papaver somniferum]|uniref:uncharacterized protein LOC113272482 n=1 Tax=Papaver somniferum TaxID=3469 RepID=UPI000E6F7969|nr:uncharacterized protein LOC113272482 [Papaver somniferum]